MANLHCIVLSLAWNHTHVTWQNIRTPLFLFSTFPASVPSRALISDNTQANSSLCCLGRALIEWAVMAIRHPSLMQDWVGLPVVMTDFDRPTQSKNSTMTGIFGHGRSIGRVGHKYVPDWPKVFVANQITNEWCPITYNNIYNVNKKSILRWNIYICIFMIHILSKMSEY